MTARAAASDSLRGQIADSLTAGLLVINGSGSIEVLNPAARRLLEVTADPIGASFKDVLASAPPLVAVIGECLDKGEPIVRRSVEMPSTMTATHLGVTVSPVAGADSMRGVICLFSDLTNVQELEEQLRLKETLARLGELTAGIAHEFRNGLATVHGYSRLIDPDALPEQYRPYVAGIRQEADALGQVVTNFLNFARPEQLSLGPVDLRGIARRAADDLQHELPAGTTVEVTGEYADVDGDDALLRQVFSNLLRNAAEACDSVGRTPQSSSMAASIARIARAAYPWKTTVQGFGGRAGESVSAVLHLTQPRYRPGSGHRPEIVLTHRGWVAIGTGRAGGAAVELTFRLTA